MNQNKKSLFENLLFSFKQFFYFGFKIKKINFNRINKIINKDRYIFIFIITNKYVKENKKVIKLVNTNKKIIKIERFYFNDWCNKNLDKNNKYVILNNFQHVKYEYRFIRNKNIKSYLIKI